MSGEEAPAGGIGRFFGSIMIVAGLLIITASGVCTAYFAVTWIAIPFGAFGQFPVGADRDALILIIAWILVAGLFGLGVGLALLDIGRHSRPKL
jgi:hypothetical protein